MMAKPVAPKRAPTIEEMLTAPPATIFEVRLGQATYMRAAANDLYGSEKYEDAMKLYERALFHCNFDKAEMSFELTDEYKKNIHETADPIHLNLALCCLKLKRYRDVITHAKDALHEGSSDPSKCKASYLIGKALISLQEYEEALKYLSELGPSFPLDKSHAVLQKEARDGIARSKKAEQQAWRGKLKSPSTEQLSPSSSSPVQTLSSAGPMPLWMALAALSVGGAVLFSFLLHLYGAVPEEDSQQQSKSI